MGRETPHKTKTNNSSQVIHVCLRISPIPYVPILHILQIRGVHFKKSTMSGLKTAQVDIFFKYLKTWEGGCMELQKPQR
jgi:3D (Asp-Asp-Asp) domain-containing protein